jgi:peptide subunit release factor RF-3
MAFDRHERNVILFASEWELRYFERHHPDVELLEESPVTTSPVP